MNMTNGQNGHRGASPDRRASLSPDRRASLTGEDSDFDMMQHWQDLALIPLKEDIADWLNTILGKCIWLLFH